MAKRAARCRTDTCRRKKPWGDDAEVARWRGSLCPDCWRKQSKVAMRQNRALKSARVLSRERALADAREMDLLTAEEFGRIIAANVADRLASGAPVTAGQIEAMREYGLSKPAAPDDADVDAAVAVLAARYPGIAPVIAMIRQQEEGRAAEETEMENEE